MRFYRIVKTPQPSEADFLSHKALNRPMPSSPELQNLWNGVSVFEHLDQAAQMVRAAPRLGSYICSLEIEAGGPVAVERTGKNEGHHTLRAKPEELLARVIETIEA